MSFLGWGKVVPSFHQAFNFSPVWMILRLVIKVLYAGVLGRSARQLGADIRQAQSVAAVVKGQTSRAPQPGVTIHSG
jgi:hypothetical protein